MRWILRLVLRFLIPALAAGCGAPETGLGGTGSPVAAQCAPLAGSYSLTYTTRSGTCGNIPQQTWNSTDPEPNCTGGSQTESADHCTGTVSNVYCTTSSGSAWTSGAITGSYDGSSASATLSLTVYDTHGTFVCSGSYDVAYRRL